MPVQRKGSWKYTFPGSDPARIWGGRLDAILQKLSEKDAVGALAAIARWNDSVDTRGVPPGVLERADRLMGSAATSLRGASPDLAGATASVEKARALVGP